MPRDPKKRREIQTFSILSPVGKMAQYYAACQLGPHTSPPWRSMGQFLNPLPAMPADLQHLKPGLREATGKHLSPGRHEGKNGRELPPLKNSFKNRETDPTVFRQYPSKGPMCGLLAELKLTKWKGSVMKTRIQSTMKPFLLMTLPALLLAASLRGQSTVNIPGVPEPGMTLWGTVTSSIDGQPVTITSASWALTDTAAMPTSFTMSSSAPAGGEPKPYIRIITQGATTYYVMQVPFDSRTIGNEASELYLADPNQQDNTARRYPSFPLKPANPPTYTLAPTVNNLPATVKSVDGINVTQTAYSTPGTQNPGFTFTERARTVRVDLSIAPIIDDFDVWAAGFFPGHPTPQSGQTVDADGDGQDNYSEYLAGTNPTQGNSVMRILTMTRAANGTNVTLNWASVSGKKYQIESSSTAGNAPDPWSPLGSEFTASGSASSLTVPASPTEPRRFFRVRIVP